MLLKTEYEKVEPYITKDGSIIRELMHPSVHGNSEQSLAEATVAAGGKTMLHKHRLTEEIYHITEGSGIMTLGAQEFEVSSGDTVCIQPETLHRIRNTGEKELKILCCCTPAYSHEDTELME
ncbi:MAG TPA: cupin domain-containing protein [Methanosarcina sp.]|nr:cupin domain-containing protein [Methanosarcina sp.]